MPNLTRSGELSMARVGPKKAHPPGVDNDK